MRKLKFIWQLFVTYLLIAIITVVAISVSVSSYFRNFHINELADDLAKRASLISDIIADDMSGDDYRSLDSLCDTLAIKTNTRITVILPSGEVIYDSEHNPAEMDNHADRPEIMEALAGKNGRSIRHSFTLSMDMLYVAVPSIEEGNVEYVLRISVPLMSVSNTLSLVYGRIALAAVILIIIIAVISLALTRRISGPIGDLKIGAERFADGDLERKIYTAGSREIGALADSMNKMAGELHTRIKELSLQKNEQEAILSSMTEGVIAIDNDESILSYNRAAEIMLNLGQDSRGKSLRESVLNSDFLSFAEKTLAEKENIEGDIVIYNHDETHLTAHGTLLLDSNDNKIGALIVLNDVTRIRRLEKIRRDFVSNVSHELRTPITSIKGYLETAIEEYTRSGENVKRFLDTALRQADRLNHIIDDLLTLSRIERAEMAEFPARQPVFIKSILESAIQSCAQLADEKNIAVKLSCPENLEGNVQGQLFEQAIINLLENAVNYSDNNSEVKIEAFEEINEIVIKVIDSGIGIEKKHIHRIFERFYRVDKARSRSTGGTGLGLAIVKHIVYSQGGEINVESTPGEGSVFIIRLPL
jgi:two-component system phosphate regulon sensor histidine kinase PhoR